MISLKLHIGCFGIRNDNENTKNNQNYDNFKYKGIGTLALVT
jgi:hypothetical protein